jgi:DNA replication protein DnaC
MLEPSNKTGVSLARQEKILAHIRSNPLDSYVFSGAPGVGKTTLLRECERQARIARPKNFPVYAKTMPEFQRDTTAAARGEYVRGLVKPESLAQDSSCGCRWGIFLDDFDKVSGSEFIRLLLFNFVNSIYVTKTQLVLSTNMSKLEFAKFFGDAVSWRIQEHCNWVELVRDKTAAV